jgi:hypothetical protein
MDHGLLRITAVLALVALLVCGAAWAADTASPSRVVLEGVPRIGMDVHMSPFPGSLFSLLEYLKDPCDYDYIMGVSGAAFRRTWNRDDGGNVDFSYFGKEPFKAILDALGYEYRMVPPKDRAVLLRALKGSLARGRPVLAFGIVGPPECGIVAGYDKDGDVLIGYSYFQDMKQPGYYEQADWFTKASWHGVTGFIVLEGRKPKPAPRAVLLSSLERAIRFARMKTLGKDHSAGLAAYDDWAKGLEIDADYPKDDAKVLDRRVMVHGDQCVMLEERRDAAKFLRRMAQVAPEVAEELNAAAARYDQVADQGGKTWPWGERYADVGPDLADPAARRTLAAAVRTAREKEAEAVGHLERALAKLKRASD